MIPDVIHFISENSTFLLLLSVFIASAMLSIFADRELSEVHALRLEIDRIIKELKALEER